MGAGPHANPLIGAVDGTPCGAPNWGEARRRTRPLGPWVELLLGHDPPEGCAEFGLGTAWEDSHWDCEKNLRGTNIARVCQNRLETACEYAHWGNKKSSLWATIRARGVPKWVRGCPLRP